MSLDVEKKLKEIIVKNSIVQINPEDINDESDLINDFGFDSIQLIKFLVDIEQELGIEFEDEYLSFDILGKYLNLKEAVISKTNA